MGSAEFLLAGVLPAVASDLDVRVAGAGFLITAFVVGVVVGAEAVLGANVVLTASTPIIDVTGSEPVEYRGVVPPRSIVVPGTRPKEFPAGIYQLPAALIIGTRSESTDLKISLNDALRSYGVAV